MDSQQKRGCLNLITGLFNPNKKQPDVIWEIEDGKDLDTSLPFRVRDDFLSFAELSFFQLLKDSVEPAQTVCTKVALSDIFFVTNPNKNVSAYNRINRKHVDFLICDSKTMRPRLAIELDDSSHQRSDRQERDEFVNQVFEAANLPLLHVPVRRFYNTQELTELIQQALPVEKNLSHNDNTTPQYEVLEEGQATTCPKCGAVMILRVARQGSHAGKSFYGCPNYPRCKTILPAPKPD